MNKMLQDRIDALMGMGAVSPMQMQSGGEVDMTDMMMSDPVLAGPAPEASNADLEAAINELLKARDTAMDPAEAEKAGQMADSLQVKSQAPMSELAMQLAAQGRGEDTTLAHLRPGEVILPPEMFDDATFEQAVEARFEDLDLDPERYVVGLGIASLNPSTGLEEFGWFKKTFKSLKKVVKKVAPVAMFIPGIGTALGAALGGIGGLAGAALAKVPILSEAVSGIGAAVKGLGSLGIPGLSPAAQGAIQAGKSGVLSTIGGALKNPLAGGLLGGKGSTYGGITGQEGSSDFFRKFLDKLASTGPQQEKAVSTARESGASDKEIYEEVQKQNPGLVERFAATFLGGGAGGGFGARDIASLGAAGVLGKLAYDAAKDRRGVPLTPLTQMDAAGRYNIEAEIARRMGKEAPNPVEFGLLPQGTLPTLSGGRPTPTPRGEPQQTVMVDGQPVTQTVKINEDDMIMMRYGGPVMAFAEGGNVAMQDFERMDGKIEGPGTERSDDIPAMLSDGEFVMTGQAVRGAGAFDMAKGAGGIITLTPNGEESRERGTKLMYDMMDLFKDFAQLRA